MRAVLVSDTHNRPGWDVLPQGDLLIHCGDGTMGGKRAEVYEFAQWLKKHPHKRKVFVPGNHDFAFEDDRLPDVLEMFEGWCDVLIDQGTEVDGLKVWGSPYQPWFLDWAFNVERGPALKAHWDKIPEGTDILVTHTPPYGILDKVPSGEWVGDRDLLNAALRVKPKLHCFGHIHDAYGKVVSDGTTFVNCSLANERYQLVNTPVVVDL